MEESVGTMTENTEVGLVQAVEVARQATLNEAPNGLRYTGFGDLSVTPDELHKLVNAVPVTIAAALADISWFFVPLAMAEARSSADGSPRGIGHRERPEETLISPGYTSELAEQAICHRNVELPAEREGIFISTRLLPDRFSLAFEFFINAAHSFVDSTGVPEAFAELAWGQVLAEVRGETSNDAWEHRNAALHQPDAANPDSDPTARSTGRRIDERAKTAYLEATFSDAVAIYMLSLAIDIDYAELRERDYPLLAPHALAERLRHVNTLFPPSVGYDFAVKYRRRG